MCGCVGRPGAAPEWLILCLQGPESRGGCHGGVEEPAQENVSKYKYRDLTVCETVNVISLYKDLKPVLDSYGEFMYKNTKLEFTVFVNNRRVSIFLLSLLFFFIVGLSLYLKMCSGERKLQDVIITSYICLVILSFKILL